jgi:hypothetical protein
MAYVGVEEETSVCVGDFVGVIVGDGVRLRVGTGLSVSDGLSATLSVEVFFCDSIGVLADVSITVTAPISLLLGGVPSGGVAESSQAALMKMITVAKNITLPVLGCRDVINKHVRVTYLDQLIR